MKKMFFMAILSFATCSIAFSQIVQPTRNLPQAKTIEKVTFTRSDQQRIQRILGNEFTAVLGPQGQLAVVTPSKVRDIRATPKGGFTGTPGNAANATFAAYEKAWIYKQSSGEVLRNKLGEERFKQLQTIMSAKGLPMQ